MATGMGLHAPQHNYTAPYLFLLLHMRLFKMQDTRRGQALHVFISPQCELHYFRKKQIKFQMYSYSMVVFGEVMRYIKVFADFE